MSRRCGRRAGFTLIELLTVIAIIAILAAILFPVFTNVRKRVQETRCASNLHQISQAVELYYDTWDRYPVTLGTVFFDTQPTVGYNPMAQFIKSPNDLHCPTSLFDANDPTQARPVKRFPNPPNGAPLPGQFLRGDSYDMGLVPNRAGSQFELHYTLDWTQCPASHSDNPRQLKYKNPPANTVVTWCLNHADVNTNGNVTDNVIVLWKDGHVSKNTRGERFSLSRWTGGVVQPCGSGTITLPSDGYQWLVNP